jgi:hypothetical protein
MNGAMADVWERIKTPPKRSRTIIMGRSQNFFRALIKAQISPAKDTVGHLTRMYQN